MLPLSSSYKGCSSESHSRERGVALRQYQPMIFGRIPNNPPDRSQLFLRRRGKEEASQSSAETDAPSFLTTLTFCRGSNSYRESYSAPSSRQWIFFQNGGRVHIPEVNSLIEAEDLEGPFSGFLFGRRDWEDPDLDHSLPCRQSSSGATPPYGVRTLGHLQYDLSRGLHISEPRSQETNPYRRAFITPFLSPHGPKLFNLFRDKALINPPKAHIRVLRG